MFNFLKKSKTSKKRGVTLVELLVYVSVFTFVSILVVNMFISISRSFVEIKANHEITRSAGAVFEKMTREIKQSDSINLASSALGTSPSTIALNGTDSANNARTTLFNVSNGKVYYTENGVSKGSLLSESVSATSFLIRQVTIANSSAVRIEAEFTFNRGSVVRSENFQTTVILRGGY